MSNTFNLMTQLSLNDDQFKQSLQSVKQNVKDLALGVEGATGNLQEMKLAFNQLKSISFAGKTTQEIAAIEAAMGKLKDDIGDLNARAKVAGMEFGEKLGAGLQLVAAGAELASSAFVLFGADSEQADKASKYIMSLVAATQALGVIQSAVGSGEAKALIQSVALSTATAAKTAATWLYTQAQAAANAMMMANPIGLIIIAVAALAAGIYLLVNAMKKHNDEAEKEKKIRENNIKLIDETEKANSRELQIKKAQGETGVQYLKDEKTQLEENLAVINKYIESTKNQKLNKKEKEEYNKQLEKQDDLLFQIKLKNEEIKKAEKDESDQAKKDAEAKKKNLEKHVSAYDALTQKVTELENKIKDTQASGQIVTPEMIQNLNDAKKAVKDVDDAIIKLQIDSKMKNVQPVAMIAKTTKVSLTKEGIETKKKNESTDLVKVDNKRAIKANEQLQESFERTKEIAQGVGGAVGSTFANMANSLVDSLGLAEHGLEGFLNVILQTAIQVIASMLATAIANVITSSTEAGMATGVAAPIVTPALITTAVAGVLSAFAAIPSFSTGGVVPGSSYSGDNILSRLNSSEVVVNQSQQNRFMDYITGVNGIGSDKVEFMLRGDTLVGVINNHNRKIQKTK